MPSMQLRAQTLGFITLLMVLLVEHRQLGHKQVLQEQRGTEIEVTNRKVSHGSQDSKGGQDKQLSRMSGHPSSRGQVTVCR